MCKNGIPQILLPQASLQNLPEILLPQAQVVNMAFSVSEMYDLCTVKDKMSLIGIHTPTMGLIARSWKGLLDNHKLVKLLSCKVRIACASHEALDPLQIGEDTNQVAPQDMMNPILYRTCTNEGWNLILNRVYGNGTADRNSMRYFNDAFANMTATDQERVYYALLASPEWKKAMPQVGLQMDGLRPFVYTVVNTYGNTGAETGTMTADGNLGSVKASNGAGNPQNPGTGNPPLTFRGHAIPYPPVPCSYPGSGTAEGAVYPVLDPGYIPKSYVACILMPPSKNRVMYYRLVITWYVEFIKPLPLYDKYIGTDVAIVGTQVYSKGYSSSKDIVPPDNSVIDGDLKEGNTLDTVDAPLELVLQR